MVRLYVHDYKFEYYNVSNTKEENDYYCSVNIYYNFSKKPGENWDDLEYFNIVVATPFGLSKYLVKLIDQKIYSRIFFLSHLIIVNEWDETEIMNFITVELQSIYAHSEKALILKALRKFNWEYDMNPEVYEKLFK